jgi:predicted transcriptional regulator
MDDSSVFQTVSNLSKGLGHPLRWVIISKILEKGGKIQGQIVEVPGVPQSTVIQHLRDMKKSGLIEGKIFGAASQYWVVPEHLEYLISKLQEFTLK